VLYDSTCYGFKNYKVKTKPSLIIDVHVLVLSVPPCRKVAGIRSECSFLWDSHTEFENMTSLYLFGSCFSFLCLGTDMVSLHEWNVSYKGRPRPLGWSARYLTVSDEDGLRNAARIWTRIRGNIQDVNNIMGI